MKKPVTKRRNDSPTAPSSSKSLFADKRGAITIVTALALPVVIGLIALAVEFGHGLLVRDETQRIADEAAYAAALAYVATGEQSSITPAAQNIAVLNGVPASGASASLVTSPRTSTDPAVQVTITTDEPIVFGRVLGFGGSVTIAPTSYAEIVSSTPPCVLALSSTAGGITLNGGTKLSAPSCVVASQESVSVSGGASITAEDVYYNGSAPTISGGASITGTIKKVSSSDPLASNAGIIAANARAVTNESLAAPTMPTMPSAPTGGTSITFGYYPTSFSAAGCSALLSGSTWTVSCPAGGTYSFTAINVPGGLSVAFTTTGTGTTTYNISGAVTNNGSSLSFGSATSTTNVNIAGALVTGGGTTTSFLGSGTVNIWGTVTNGGSTLTFGSGTFNLAAGLVTDGGSTTTFGSGTFHIGRGPSCSSGSYSICHNGTTLTFAGPSTFVITSGICNTGGETVSLGAGTTTNSYQIGPSSSGYAFNLGGGSKTTLGDATGASSVFQMVGDLDQIGGGSSLILPAATDHDINGTVSLTGGLTLGSGLYAIAGNFWLGISSGGGTVSGSSVTIAVTGSSPKALGNLSTYVVDISAGYNNVTISAPSSGTYENVAIVGVSSTGGI